MTRTGHWRRPRGFFLMDITVGLVIAAALLLALSVSVGRLHRAQQQMAHSREAARRLEESLLRLQNGGKLDQRIQFERLSDGPAGHVWVRLSLPPAAPSEQPSSLVGLIPAPQPGGTP